MVHHITKKDYNEMQGVILASIERQDTWADVLINGIWFCFDLSYTTEEETEFTGVEFMGARERYTKRTATDIDIDFTGAYNADGEEVKTDYKAGAFRFNPVEMN